jgi:hypothetical protein
MRRTVCIDLRYREERRRKTRYMQEVSAPATVALYQICNTGPCTYVTLTKYERDFQCNLYK